MARPHRGSIMASISRMFGSSVDVRARYDAAGMGPQLSDWVGSAFSGINAALSMGLTKMRARSWEAYMNYPLASRGITRLTDIIIGTGATLDLVLEPEFDDFKVDVLTQFTRWSKKCNTDGGSFSEAQSLLLSETLIGGDSIIQKVPTKFNGKTAPLAIRVWGGDQLPEYKNEDVGNGVRIMSGIEMDSTGQVLGYHLYSNSQRDYLGTWVPRVGMVGGMETTRFPADQICHTRIKKTAQQLRGEPVYANVLIKLQDLYRYDAAELQKKLMSSTITSFITRPGADMASEAEKMAAQGGTYGNETEPGLGGNSGVGILDMQPGMAMPLNPGENMVFAPTADVGPHYEAFNRLQIRYIATALGLPYESLFPDNSQSNDRMMRIGQQDLQKMCKRVRDSVMKDQFLTPIWETWVDFSIAAKLIKLPAGMDADDLKNAASWSWNAWGYVNPMQDAQATEILLQNNVISRTMAQRDLNINPIQVDLDIAAEQARAKRLGIPMVEIAPKPDAKSGLPEGPDPTDPGVDSTTNPATAPGKTTSKTRASARLMAKDRRIYDN